MARKTLSCLIPLSTTVPKTKPPQYLTHYLNTGRSIDEAKAMIKTRTRIKTEIRKKKKRSKRVHMNTISIYKMYGLCTSYMPAIKI